MNITRSPFGPLHMSRVQVLPSTPGREKSGAGWPKSQTGVSSDTITASSSADASENKADHGNRTDGGGNPAKRFRCLFIAIGLG
jgi:hypothetical protein